MRQFTALFLAAILSVNGQQTRPSIDDDLGHGLPDLKQKQIEDLLKDDKKKSLQDTDEILKRAATLKEELDSNDQHVLSMKAIKDVEEIEKLAKRIRGRMRRF
jgi:hypothetical protein